MNAQLCGVAPLLAEKIVSKLSNSGVVKKPDGEILASNLKQNFRIWLGSTAALLAVVSALLSFAPFTPAIVLTVLTIPAGVVAASLGAWRVGTFTLYWSALAILAVPNAVPTQFESALLLAYPLGLAVGAVLLLHYRMSRIAAS